MEAIKGVLTAIQNVVKNANWEQVQADLAPGDVVQVVKTERDNKVAGCYLVTGILVSDNGSREAALKDGKPEPVKNLAFVGRGVIWPNGEKIDAEFKPSPVPPVEPVV